MNERAAEQRRMWRGLTGDRSKGTCDNKERTKNTSRRLGTTSSRAVKLAVSEGPCQWFFAWLQGVGATWAARFRRGVSATPRTRRSPVSRGPNALAALDLRASPSPDHIWERARLGLDPRAFAAHAEQARMKLASRPGRARDRFAVALAARYFLPGPRPPPKLTSSKPASLAASLVFATSS